MEEELHCLLPFETPAGWEKWATGQGRCIQGNNTEDTHQGYLRHAFDFKLRRGTQVLAARDGVVAYYQDHFREGGTRRALLPRSNLVALRHSDGVYTRYIHLMPGGVLVQVGQEVRAGQPIALSGNTGFTSEPHLHFDAVDILPQETSELRLLFPGDGVTIPSVAAIFSGPLGVHNDVVAPLVYLSSEALLSASSSTSVPGDTRYANVESVGYHGIHGGIHSETPSIPFIADVVVLMDRGGAGGNQTFAKAAATAAAAVALTHCCRCVGVILANNRAGHEVFAMAPPWEENEGPARGASTGDVVGGVLEAGSGPKGGRYDYPKDTLKEILPVVSPGSDTRSYPESAGGSAWKITGGAFLPHVTDEYDDDNEDGDSMGCFTPSPAGWRSSSSSSSWSTSSTDASSSDEPRSGFPFTSGGRKIGRFHKRTASSWSLPKTAPSSSTTRRRKNTATDRGERRPPLRAPFPVVMVSQESGQYLKDALSAAEEANNDANSTYNGADRFSPSPIRAVRAAGGSGFRSFEAAGSGQGIYRSGHATGHYGSIPEFYGDQQTMGMQQGLSGGFYMQRQGMVALAEAAGPAAPSPQGVVVGLRASEHCPVSLTYPAEMNDDGGWEAKPMVYGAQTLPVVFERARPSF